MFDYLKGEAKKSTTGLVVISDLGINDDEVSAIVHGLNTISEKETMVYYLGRSSSLAKKIVDVNSKDV